MKAIVQDRFGPPDVLQLADTDLPEAGADDVLVRVHAARSTRPTGTSCEETRSSRGSWAWG
jgi:NADPH:quinone reductase-like Zn-dependent oxidoreductase